MKNYAKQIKKGAQSLGACQPGLDELKEVGDNKVALCKLFLKRIDFCLENDFPSNDFIREHGKGVMENFGIFLDDAINLTNYRKCVALGVTSGNVLVGSYNVCEIFAKHQSKLHIEATDNAFVKIEVYDDAEITIQAHDRAKVYVKRHGGKITTAKDGQAVVKVETPIKQTK